MKRPSSRRWALAQLFVFAALFVWMRWFSTLWQNRWTGFCLGIAFAATNFAWRESLQRQLDLARKYDVPRRVTILSAIASAVVGITVLKSFFAGSAFSWSGVRAASDDGFCGVIVCTSALEWAFFLWGPRRNLTDQRPQNPMSPVNHG